jgi:CBS domain-containing protein
MDLHTRQSGRLAIRTRKIAEADGESTTMTVYCPPRRRSLAVDECIACASCGGLTLDPTGRNSFLMCAQATAPQQQPPSRVTDGPSALRAAETPVSEVMSRQVVCVPQTLDVRALAQLLLERGISGAPVVDDEGLPIGVVSKTDLIRERFDDTEEIEAEPLRVRTRQGYEYELGPGFHAERITSRTVADIMTPLVFSLPEDAPVSQAAALMALEGVHRVPVIADGGTVVGMLTSMDVLRWLAEQDGYLPSPE